jgi:hypothetical protein
VGSFGGGGGGGKKKKKKKKKKKIKKYKFCYTSFLYTSLRSAD